MLQIISGVMKKGFSTGRFILTIIGFTLGTGIVLIVYLFLTLVIPVGMQ